MKAVKIVVIVSVAALVLTIAGVCALWLKPPDLLRIGAAYSAKIVCSNVFLAKRDADEVLESDIQAPGIAVLKFMRVSVDKDDGVVHAGFLGFIGNGLAVYAPHRGCTVLPDGKLDLNAQHERMHMAASLVDETNALNLRKVQVNAQWPEGNAASTNPAMDRILANEDLTGPGMRAAIIVDHGHIVGERYTSGFNVKTPLLGWSMTKSVVAGLVGILVKDGKLTLDQTAFWPSAPADDRDLIRLSDLLSMSSGLKFNENYGTVSDVTRMLYLEPDMAGFARSQPLSHTPGSHWSYSSGTAVILSRIVQDAVGSNAHYFVRQRLFQPLGMTTAVIEPDEHGTLVGSSYMYATARDWARYAQFLLQGGVWDGQELLPPGYVAMMAEPVVASGGQYGHGQVWLWGSEGDTPGTNPDAAFDIPSDTFWMSGHDGQLIAIIPSRQIVVLRMGLTPSTKNYTTQRLVQAVLEESTREAN